MGASPTLPSLRCTTLPVVLLLLSSCLYSQHPRLAGAQTTSSPTTAPSTLTSSARYWLLSQGSGRLVSPKNQTSANFGTAVSVSGNGLYMATAAPLESPAGAVYVYGWNGTGWGTPQRIAPTDVTYLTSFGEALSLDHYGNRLAVGRPDYLGNGAVFIYKKGAGSVTWTLEKTILPMFVDYLTANSSFGSAVALDRQGVTCVVGHPAYSSGEIEIFSRTGTAWSFVAAMNSADSYVSRLGESIAISSDANIIAAGAPGYMATYAGQGAVIVFNISNNSYSENVLDATGTYASMEAYLGLSVTITADGRSILSGAPYETIQDGDEGRVYYFYYQAGNWIMGSPFTSAYVTSKETFGMSVAIDGTGSRAFVGGASKNASFGSAYVYYLSYNAWTYQQNLYYLANYASGTRAAFGATMATSYNGSTVAVGAPLDYITGTAQGSVTMYRSVLNWVQTSSPTLAPTTKPTRALTANYVNIVSPVTESNAYFGGAVSLSGDGKVLAIGSYTATANGKSQDGRAFIYEFKGGVSPWALRQSLYLNSTTSYNFFGASVGLSKNGSRLVVGIKTYNPNSARGGAFVYTRSRAGQRNWTREAILLPSESTSNFGASAAMRRDGYMVVIGATSQDGSGYNGQGWVYERSLGGTWSLSAKLVKRSCVYSCQLGSAVALSDDGNVVAMGAPADYVNGTQAGTACVYRRTGNSWSNCTVVLPMGGTYKANAQFGQSVSLSADGSVLAVGANYYTNTSTNQGAVFIYAYGSSQWKQKQVILGLASNYRLGSSVALSSDATYLSVGAIYANSFAGAAYVYKRNAVSNKFVLVRTLTDYDSGTYTEFGSAIAMSSNGSTVAVGIPKKNVVTYAEGSTIVYRQVEGWYDTSTSSPTRTPTVAPTQGPAPYCGSMYTVTLTNSSALHKVLSSWSGQVCRGRILLKGTSFNLGGRMYTFSNSSTNITIAPHSTITGRVFVRGNLSYNGIPLWVTKGAKLYATSIDFVGATNGFMTIRNKAYAYLTNCRFRQNINSARSFDSKRVRSAVSVYNSTLKCISCTFQDNHMTSYPNNSDYVAAALSADEYSRVYITSSIFKNNTRKITVGIQDQVCGGAVTLTGGSKAVVVDSSFTQNTIKGSSTSTKGVSVQGGAICAQDAASLTIKSTSFFQNQVVVNGSTTPKSECDGGAVYCMEADCYFDSCRFQANKAASVYPATSGGAVTGVMATFNFSKCAFYDNVLVAGNNSERGGGALVIANSTSGVYDCVFGGNTATTTTRGAAMAILYGSRTIIRRANFTKFTGSVVPYDVYVDSQSKIDCTLASYSMGLSLGVNGGTCNFATTAPTRAPTQAPTAYIAYPRIYPSIGTVNTTGAYIKVRMASAGYLYCTALTAKQPSPSSTVIKAAAYPIKTTTSNSNVTVSLTGLSAMTAYSAFCYTEDLSTPANTMPDSIIALTRVNFTTPCCYSLTVPTLPTSLYAKATSTALTMTAPTTAQLNVTIFSSYFSTLTTVSSCTLSGITALGTASGNSSRSLIINPSRTASFGRATSSSFTIYAKVSGCYYVRYNLTGSSKSLFYTPSSKALFIYEPGSPQPGPVLFSVRFSSTGSQLEATFSKSSDKAGLSGTFTCNRLVRFTGSSSASCSWSSDSLLLVTLSSTATIVPGGNFTLLGSQLKASCQATNGNCTAWPYSSAQSATILSPLTPLVPSIQASYSKRIGACTDLTIDASTSTGSGGRSMTYRWSVSSSTGNDLTNVTTYLNSTANKGYGMTIIKLPGTYLKVGSYEVYLSLTNFLGSRATSSALAVTVSGTAIPTVKILPSSINIYRSQTVSLYASVSVPSCSAATTFRYWWRESTRKIASTAVDPRYWRVSGGTLTAGSTYTVLLNVTDSQNNSNTATATVIVERTPLLVSITGGDRVLPSTRSLSLDASSSYDPDKTSLGSAGLNYTWTCIKGGTSYGSACGLSSFSAAAKVTVGTLSEGVYIFTVSGSTRDGRSASASVVVTALASEPPYVSLGSLGSDSTKVNPASKLFLSAVVTDARTSGNLTWAWSLEYGTLSGGGILAATASTTTSGVRRLSSTQTGSFPLSLILPASSLLSKATYRIRLTVSSTAGSGRSEIAFTTNGAPTSGSLSVSPTSGQPLLTSFTFTTANWVDDADDYPLSYTFMYKVGAESTSGLTERPLLSDTYLTVQSGVLLPEGGGSKYNVTAVVYAKDKYGASARTYQGFNVPPLSVSVMSLSSNISGLLQSAVDTFNVEAVYQIVSASSAGLSSSSSSCTNTAACTSLRSTLLSYVSAAVGIQDSSQTVLLQQAQALETLTSDRGTLSTSSQSVAVQLISTITSRAGSGTGLDEDGVSSVGGTLNSLMQTNIVQNSSQADSLSSSLTSLVRASWVNLHPGENGVSLSTSSLNMTNAVYYASGLVNKTLSPPGTNNSVVLPPGGAAGFYAGVADTDSVSTAVLSMKNLRKDKRGKNATSNVLRFSLTTSGSTSTRRLSTGTSSDSVSTTLGTTSPQHYASSGYTGSLNCTRGEKGVKSHTCTNGQQTFSLRCNGTAAHRAYECRAGNRSACGMWDESKGAYSSANCKVVSYSSDQTKCQCISLGSYDTSVSARELFVDMVALTESVLGDFLDTLRVAKSINLATVVTNIVVFITIGIILQGGAILCFLGYRRDVNDYRARLAAAQANKELNELEGVVDPTLSPEENKLLLKSLPEFVKTRDYWELMVSEMGRRHDYFSIAMVYSRVYSRAYRVALLVTTTMVLMFTNALLYSLAYPDMGCESTTEEYECTAKTSPMNPGQGACSWDGATGLCASADNESNFYSQIVVAVVSSLFTAPINMLLKYIFERMIIPPVKDAALVAYERKQREAERISNQGRGVLRRLFSGTPVSKVYVYPDGDPGLLSPTGPYAQSPYASPPGSPTFQQQQQNAYAPSPYGFPPASSQQEQGLPAASTSPVSEPPTPAKSPVSRIYDSLVEVKKKRAEHQVIKAEEKRKFNQALELEAGKIMSRVAQQREELQQVIKLLKEYQAKINSDAAEANPEAEQQRKRLAQWIERLEAFGKQFDDRWQLDEHGQVKPDSKWDKFRGRTYMTRLQKRLKEELFMSKRLEMVLLRLPEKQREIRLMEFQRIDFLTRAERKIYLRNQIEFQEEVLPPPVDSYIKVLGWVLLVLVDLFFGFYIILFGISRGAATTNSWLSSFIISIVQDPLVNVPFVIVFYHVWLPLLIKHKIKARIDGARSEPYVFKAFIPTGPACRVALKHPEWASAQIVKKTLVENAGGPQSSQQQQQGAFFPLHPPSGSGQMGAQASRFQADFQDRSAEYFLRTEAVKDAAGFCLFFSLASVYIFLALPGKLQDMATQYAVSILSGAILFGYAVLEAIKPVVCYVLLALMVVLIAIALAAQFYSHHHHPAVPIATMLGISPASAYYSTSAPVGDAVMPFDNQPSTPRSPTARVTPEPPGSITVNNPFFNRTPSVASPSAVSGDFRPVKATGGLDIDNIHSALGIIKAKRAIKAAEKTAHRGRSRSSSGGAGGSGDATSLAEDVAVTDGAGGDENPRRRRASRKRSSATGMLYEVDLTDDQDTDLNPADVLAAVKTIKAKTHRGAKARAGGFDATSEGSGGDGAGTRRSSGHGSDGGGGDRRSGGGTMT